MNATYVTAPYQIVVRLRLTRKFAALIDGVDFSRVREGDELQLSARDARLLVAEGWAVPSEHVERSHGNGGAARANPG